MAFTPKSWQNGLAGGTKLNAAALTDLETRLSAYTDSLTGAVLDTKRVSADYTLVAADAGTIIEVDSVNPVTVTVPPNVFVEGKRITVVRYGSGPVSLAKGAGVTFLAPIDALSIGTRGGQVQITKSGTTNEFYIDGSTLSQQITGKAWDDGTLKLASSDTDWLGGDIGLSVDLGDGRSVMLFGNSYIAKSPERERINAHNIANSILYQSGSDLLTAKLEYAWRKDGLVSNLLARENARAFYQLAETGVVEAVNDSVDGHVGSVDGTISFGQPALLRTNPFAKSAEFGGTGRIIIQNHVDFQMTGGLGIRASVIPGTGTNDHIVAKVNQWHAKTNAAKNPGLHVWRPDGEYNAYALGVALEVGREYELEFGYNAIDGTISIYVDGKAQTVTYNKTKSAGNITPNTTVVEIGAWFNSGRWTGSISNVLISSTAPLAQDAYGSYEDAVGRPFFPSIIPGTDKFQPTGAIKLDNTLVVAGYNLSAVNNSVLGWRAFYVNNLDSHPLAWEVQEQDVVLTGLTPIQAPYDAGDGFVYWLTPRNASSQVFLARVPRASMKITDYSGMTWWNGSAWSSNSATAVSIWTEAVTNGGNIIKLYDGTLMYVATNNTNITIRTSLSITGPWSVPQNIYTVPEMVSPIANSIVYNAYAHPEQDAGADDLVVSYNYGSTVAANVTGSTAYLYPRLVKFRNISLPSRRYFPPLKPGTVLHETVGKPDPYVGTEGDWAIDKKAGRIYGPRDEVDWPDEFIDTVGQGGFTEVLTRTRPIAPKQYTRWIEVDGTGTPTGHVEEYY